MATLLLATLRAAAKAKESMLERARVRAARFMQEHSIKRQVGTSDGIGSRRPLQCDFTSRRNRAGFSYKARVQRR